MGNFAPIPVKVSDVRRFAPVDDRPPPYPRPTAAVLK